MKECGAGQVMICVQIKWFMQVSMDPGSKASLESRMKTQTSEVNESFLLLLTLLLTLLPDIGVKGAL